MIRYNLCLLLSFTLLFTFSAQLHSAEKSAHLAYTKENAQKWLARAETYAKQRNPESKDNSFLDIELMQINLLLDNEPRAKELLNSPALQEKDVVLYAQSGFATALILKNQSVEEACRFIDSLGIAPQKQWKIYSTPICFLLNKKHYRLCDALIAHYNKPENLSSAKHRLIEAYLKTGQLENAKRLLKPIVAKDAEEQKDLDKLQNQMKYVQSRIEQNNPMPIPTNRRLPGYELLAMFGVSVDLPKGTSEEKTAYLQNEADDITRAMAYREIAEAMGSETKTQQEAKKICLNASLEATKKLPLKSTRYINLLKLAALYEEEGEVATAKPPLREATDYLYQREKEIKEKAQNSGEDNPLSILSNFLEHGAMAPLACDIYLRLGELDEAVRLTKTINTTDLWNNLARSAVKTIPASNIEQVFQEITSPDSKAAFCSGIALEIAEELHMKPEADKP